MSLDKHREYLDKHCRVCGKPHGKATRYSCSKYSTILQVLVSLFQKPSYYAKSLKGY